MRLFIRLHNLMLLQRPGLDAREVQHLQHRGARPRPRRPQAAVAGCTGGLHGRASHGLAQGRCYAFGWVPATARDHQRQADRVHDGSGRGGPPAQQGRGGAAQEAQQQRGGRTLSAPAVAAQQQQG